MAPFLGSTSTRTPRRKLNHSRKSSKQSNHQSDLPSVIQGPIYCDMDDSRPTHTNIPLPGELRNKIYTYLLLDRDIIFNDRLPKNRNLMRMALTCKAMYEDTMSLYYYINKSMITSSYHDIDTPLPVLEKIEARFLDRVAYLSVNTFIGVYQRRLKSIAVRGKGANRKSQDECWDINTMQLNSFEAMCAAVMEKLRGLETLTVVFDKVSFVRWRSVGIKEGDDEDDSEREMLGQNIRRLGDCLMRLFIRRGIDAKGAFRKVVLVQKMDVDLTELVERVRASGAVGEVELKTVES